MVQQYSALTYKIWSRKKNASEETVVNYQQQQDAKTMVYLTI